MRIIAMYLPQFHEIPENNVWWGDGYTEWRAVKNAKPLFEGHLQPRIPLNGYYNLLEKKSMEEQAFLMKKYGVDGLCFYHYYFKNGKKLLEKPAENLLKWTDIDMPFCFSWANESWIKTWSKVAEDTNAWTSIYEKNSKVPATGVLMEQAYGNEQDWMDHFYYLLPFFKDNRYIKLGNRPVFVIYKVNNLYCMLRMKKCWDELCDKEGIGRIYYISTNVENEYCDAMMLQEPQHTFELFYKDINYKKGVNVYQIDYDHLWGNMLRKELSYTKPVNLGGFMEYDDTPRHGKNGIVVQGANPTKFGEYFNLLRGKAGKVGSKFIFLNAWNEWAEGMYLEPDSNNQYGYLQAIKNSKNADFKKYVSDKVVNFIDDEDVKKVEFARIVQDEKRYQEYTDIYSRWLNYKLSGGSISKSLLNKGYKRIAIYGMAMMGQLLATELSQGGIVPEYGIDKIPLQYNTNIKIYLPDDKLPEVDLVIVTLGYGAQEVVDWLYKLHETKAITIKNLMREL